jgi:uncharacterized protein (DUF488 family)
MSCRRCWPCCAGPGSSWWRISGRSRFPGTTRNSNRERFAAGLAEAGLGYLFLGAELGGRPPEPEFYDSAGHVRYGALARTERFNAGLRRLLAESGRQRVAMLCSEEDPRRCHRRLLVTRALTARGIPVRHIRGDGSVIREEDLGPLPQETSQGTLFG